MQPALASSLHLGDWTWEELAQVEAESTPIVLPLGALEAHGPHLPLSTDVIIAEAMARCGAERLRARGYLALVAPALAFTVAKFASTFPGTVSVRPETASALLEDIGRSLLCHGFKLLVIANAHLDPEHIRSIHQACARLEQAGMSVIYPDLTRKPWALRLSDEFKSGACHAGQFEGSIVLAERPDLVREELRQTLPANPKSLSVAIRQGLTSFEQAGGPRAYFGAPAAASAPEGQRTLATLGSILEDALLAHLAASSVSAATHSTAQTPAKPPKP